MKKISLLVVSALILMIQGYAQTVVISRADRAMSASSVPVTALSVHIIGTDAKDALKDFESFWKDRGARPDIKDDELKAENFSPKELKPNVYTLYGRSEKESKNDCTIYLWVNNGSQYIGPNDPAYKYFEQELRAFAVAENRRPIEKDLREATKALEIATDDKKSLEKDRVGWQKDIDDCNESIRKYQAKLKDSESDLKEINRRLQQQQDETSKLKQRLEGIQ